MDREHSMLHIVLALVISLLLGSAIAASLSAKADAPVAGQHLNVPAPEGDGAMTLAELKTD
jgi:hypothetical protein